MEGSLSGDTGRILGGLATAVVILGVVGSVLTLVTAVGSQEAFVVLLGAGVLWLNAVVGIRAVSSTETVYW
jgi:hypothetical protein